MLALQRMIRDSIAPEPPYTVRAAELGGKTVLLVEVSGGAPATTDHVHRTGRVRDPHSDPRQPTHSDARSWPQGQRRPADRCQRWQYLDRRADGP